MKQDDLLNRTLDLLSSNLAEENLLPATFPPAERFPLNVVDQKVQDVVISDLKESLNPLIVTGFASLDRLLDFCTDHCMDKPDAKICLLIGHEPFESRKQMFSVKVANLPADTEAYWLKRGISLLYSAKLIQMLDLLKSGRVMARYFPGNKRLHAKIYCGDHAATVGSSNFTDPGMAKQFEANTRFTAQKDAKRFQELCKIASNYWSHGENYNAWEPGSDHAQADELPGFAPWLTLQNHHDMGPRRPR